MPNHWAFQQIADRLEGKPVQVVDATVDENRTVDQFSDVELSAPADQVCCLGRIPPKTARAVHKRARAPALL
jgi:hypothetical protein